MLNGAAPSALFEGFDRFENFFDVSSDFDPAPLEAKNTLSVDQKGAPLDPLDLFAIHDLVLDHTEHVAELFFSVSDQLERQFKVLLELLVRGQIVSRDPKNHRARLDKIFMAVTKLHGFSGASRSGILGVKVQHDALAHVGLRRELDAAGRDRFEFREGFVDSWGHEIGLEADAASFMERFAGSKTQ